MNGLKTMKGLLNRARRARGLAAAALAALIVFPTMHAPARAQSGGGSGAGKVSLQDVHFTATVGRARGQTLRVSGINTLMADGSVRIVGGYVKVFDGRTGALVASFLSFPPTAGLYTFDIGNGRDVLVGGAGDDVLAGRVQLLIEVKLVVRYEQGTQEPGAGVHAPTFEVFDNISGRTTVHGVSQPNPPSWGLDRIDQR